MSLAQSRIVFYRSADGLNGWEPVMDSEVPGWVKEPDNLGVMVHGNLAHREDEAFWYAAVTIAGSEIRPAAPQIALP